MDANQITLRTMRQAVEVLRSRFGARIDGGPDSGTQAMRLAIESGLGLSPSQAEAVVAELIEQRQVIYIAAVNEKGYWSISDSGETS